MNRVLKLAISSVVRLWDIFSALSLQLAGRKPAGRFVVLYYHAVSAEERVRFAGQMDVLLKLARPISTNSPPVLERGKRYVCVTFDDAFLSVKENAAPELARRQIPWTLFVPSGQLGKKPEWLRQPEAAARQDRVMTVEELRALSRDPLVTIGSHTVNHRNLLELSAEEAACELAQSRTDLENVTGKPVHEFSYPFGARDSARDDQALRAGYRRVFSSEPECLFGREDRVVCGRVSVSPRMSAFEFRLKVLGSYRWLAALHRLK